MKIKVLYKDKVEPTQVLDSNDKNNVTEIVNNILVEVLDDSSDIVGLFISND